jgi:predicted 3-demethylubiquinone-9 3-methyltransferase (glyoxalase superfamily)
MAQILPSLWYTEKAEEAAAFYASVLPDSRVDSITVLPAENPSGPAGTVTLVDFTLMGRPFSAMSAGKHHPFNHAMTLMVQCDSQAEIDRLWVALSEGGAPGQCGWLADRFGVSWQIVPTALRRMMKDPDLDRVSRVALAMLKMAKIDMAVLDAAFRG